MGRMTLHLSGIPAAKAPCGEDTDLAAPGSLSQGPCASGGTPSDEGVTAAQSEASAAAAVAAAIAAIYPVVQLLPVTAKVRSSAYCKP
jgi:hypothetical protein